MDPEVIAGQEKNLVQAPCARCQEPMYHLCEVEATYPLCRLWRLACGECGAEQLGWEELETQPRWPSPPVEADELGANIS